jgi:hypothetical protein
MTATKALLGTQPNPSSRDGLFTAAARPTERRGQRRTALLVAIVICALAAGLTGASSAPAFTGSAWWKLNSGMLPSKLPEGADGTITLTAINLGDGSTSGEATISDLLPPGLKVKEKEVEGVFVPEVEFFALGFAQAKIDLGPTGFPFLAEKHFCEVVGSRVACKYVEGPEPPLPPVAPYEDIELRIHVTNESAVAGSVLKGEVSGGATPPQTSEHKLDVGSEPPQFGIEAQGFSLVPEEEGGAVDTQAGSHPFQLTTTIALNQTANEAKPPALPHNLQFKLPPGLIGNAAAIPQCSDRLFRTRIPGVTANECPASTAVGAAVLNVDEPNQLQLATLAVPVFNLEPGNGEPARFGFEFAGSAVTLDTGVRSGRDYGVTVSVSNITELTNFISSTVTFWGAPGDRSHDHSRGWQCLIGGHGIQPEGGAACPPGNGSQASPFLTLPSSCAVPFTTIVQGDSWPRKANPAAEAQSIALPEEQYALKDALGHSLAITGCNQEPFGPLIEVSPDGHAASSPAAGKVDVHVPQEVSQNPQGIASANVKDISVTFPQGVTVNPAAADGLLACPQALAGFQGFEELPSLPGFASTLFSAELSEPLQPGVNVCPDASKIGKVVIRSPLLPAGQLVQGSLYLAQPAPNGEEGKNPFNSLLAAYIIAKDPVSGVVVKLAGSVSLDPVSGQITANFKNNPDLAFEDAEIELFGGQRSPFASQSHCGPSTTNATFTPWSGAPVATSSSTFQVQSGPNGTPCPPASLPFAPTLAAGTTNNNAATFSPLTTTIGREDGEQFVNSVQLHMPPGLAGVIAGIPRCAEAQANAGACSPASLIGHATASVGVGTSPFTVTGGQVFLTEAYKGAPFGLSIVTPAVAGPFNLGNVIVRAKIEVDSSTAALTVTTDEIPHILKGVPLDIRHVNVTIDRPNFTFNTTNCNPLPVTGTIGALEGAKASVSSSYQATNCATLKFAPKFSASTSAKTSKANGASLRVKIAYPSGGQANLARVDLTIPAILPTRLTTIQKACTEAQFNANPAGCPAASVIATAIVHTPILSSPLSGPVYFVSHGNAAFPDVEMILSGEGVTLVVDGKTQIKKGVTFSHFETVPDEPFSFFEFVAPQGPHSIFAANGNLCANSIAMATKLTAQNGAVINQSTPVVVEGCSNGLKVLSHSIHKRTLTIKVAVPSAGRLTATAKGMTKTSKTAKGRSTVTLSLNAKKSGKLKTKVKLSFAPTKGSRLVAAVTARFGG